MVVKEMVMMRKMLSGISVFFVFLKDDVGWDLREDKGGKMVEETRG